MGPEVKRHFPIAGLLLAMALVAAPDATLAGQSRFFPDVPSFDLPLAAPRAASFAGRVIWLSRGESRFGAEQEGDVSVGESFPTLALRRGPRPVTLDFGVQVFGRFSLDDSKTAMISSDWTTGFTLHTTRERWELALQFSHESSHLGDEYANTFQANRLDWTREILSGWVGYRAGGWQIMMGGSRAMIDQLKLSPWLAAMGVDYRAGGITVLGQRMVPVAGVFFDGMSATDWRINSNAKLGLAIAGANQGREFRLSLIRHDGLSTQRQFFRRESRYFGLEIEFQS
jgi:hypothetical protein